MKEKYIPFEIPSESKEYWNQVQFLGCKVMDIQIQEFKSGTRMSITIASPKFHKKYYLFTWNDTPMYDAILNSGLQKDDIISCYTELSYYKSRDKKGNEVYSEAYQILPNYNFNANDKESPTFFKLMHIKRQIKEPAKTEKKPQFLSADELLKKMLG